MTLVHSSRTPMLGARQRLGCYGLRQPSIRTRTMRAYAVPGVFVAFGFIMFKNGTSNSVDKVLIPYAREIADAPEDAVPLWSWGSVVWRRRTVAFVMLQIESNARFRGCALLLRLWSYERLAVGRPIVDHRGYEARYYGRHDDDGPTMGTLWVCPRERTWANERARRTYPSFVVALDRLVAEDVIWEPYSAAAVGKSCSLWVVFYVHVERDFVVYDGLVGL
ncbi:hypothetical protein U9M48_033117 [Paspalum notatum var. saurae]|uniref:Aminotransferase-like plant mobile domain-containing protein n=1 Tax=Paspalum notatum var. saurae TaxID=547442 RepID=A0AAQ3X604_PASNO